VRKLVIFAIMVITVIPLVWGAVTAPTSFVASAPTPTKITFTWSGQSELDSLALFYFSGSDSIFVAYFDTTQPDSTVIGFTPNTQYIFQMYARASGKKAVSDPDTMNTKVEYKYRIPSSIREGSIWLPDYTFDPGDIANIIYTLNAADETQTTCYFKPQATSTIGIYLLNSVSDSCKFTGRIYGGWDDSTNTAVGGAIQGLNVVGDVQADSIEVTSHLQNSNAAHKIVILPYDWAYIVWTGDTACGNKQQFMVKYGYSKE